MSIHIDKERNRILISGWVPIVADNKLPIVYDTYWDAFEHAVNLAEVVGNNVKASAEYIEECENWDLFKGELAKYIDLGE